MADRHRKQLAKKLRAEGKPVEAGWADFWRRSFPPDAPVGLLDRTRLIYMAGAYHMFSEVATLLVRGREPTEDDYHLVDLIYDELGEFLAELDQLAAKAEGTNDGGPSLPGATDEEAGG